MVVRASGVPPEMCEQGSGCPGQLYTIKPWRGSTSQGLLCWTRGLALCCQPTYTPSISQENASTPWVVWCAWTREKEHTMGGIVEAVQKSGSHTLIKPEQASIRLLAGFGVEGDAHMGVTVKHRSRVARDPSQPNLRQVHLIHAELHDELRAAAFVVGPGQMGENVTTRGIDLLGLPTGTRLRLGKTAVVEVTGLRNPCLQLDRIQPWSRSECYQRNPCNWASSRLRWER